MKAELKTTILGFNQELALEYKLDLTDLCLLRYIVDFAGSGDMKIIIEAGKPFYWINYNYLKENIPIINIASNDVLRRRLKKMVDKEILVHKHLKQNGRFSYYGFGVKYKSLIINKNTTPIQKSEPSDQKVGTIRPESRNPSDPKVGTKINLLYNSSIKDIDIYSEVIDYLNKKTNSNYKATTKTNLNLIKARVTDGFELKDFIKVIDVKFAEWNNTNMEQYLRPQTLFGSKFESYLNQRGVNNGFNKSNDSTNKNNSKYELKDFNKKSI